MSLRVLKLLLAVVVCGFAAAAAYYSYAVVERQHTLRRISRYNLSWQASQTLAEFMRLHQSLQNVRAFAGDADNAELRFEIFAGTVNGLSRGAFEDVAKRYPDIGSAVSKLETALVAANPLKDKLHEPGQAEAILEILSPLQSELTKLTAATYNHGAELTTEDENELTRLHWIFSGVIGSLIALGLALIGLLARHNHLLTRAHLDLRGMTDNLTHVAHHDALTGLANRVLFRDTLVNALDKAQRDGTMVALLYLDLDLFKNVNDALGHGIGDDLLKIVAKRLRACANHETVIARLGGDEFAILLAGLNIPEESLSIAQHIIEEIGAPYEIEGHEIVIGTSIGIAFNDQDHVDPDELLKQADMALYRAKADGRGVVRAFEPAMDQWLQDRRSLETDIRKAWAARDFEIHYQPQVCVLTQKICGFEALLRWTHSERGAVPPSVFIPVAEDIGLILPLGEWVLERACTDATSWPETVGVAVNLSPVQFRDRALAESVSRALARSGLAPNRLELEVTERVLLQKNDVTLATLHKLRASGVRIAMDDFGTGYSSLKYLSSFPFDKIKIDRSFVKEMSSRAVSAAIVQSVTTLGSSLRIATTAEGIETEDQYQRVLAAGCTEVQGYYFGVPKPASELTFSYEPEEQAQAVT